MANKNIISGTLFIVFILFMASFALMKITAEAREPYTIISIDEVVQRLNKPEVHILDVNFLELWEKNHLPGAIHVDSPDLARFLPADKTAFIVFYCANQMCGMAPAAAREAAMLGYRNLYVMEEGILGWVKAGKPVESTGTGKY